VAEGEGEQPVPRTPEEVAKEMEELIRTLPSMKGKDLRAAMVKLQALSREKLRAEAGPTLTEYESLLKDIAEKSARAAELRKQLQEAGVVEEEVPEKRVRRATEEPINYKHSISPLGRYVAAKIKEAGSITEAQLREAIAPYKWSGSTGASLRGLKEIWHLIDYQGSPGVPEKINEVTYSWVASPEKLAEYNSAITKKGLEGF
jgi:hypothetical protein